MHWFIDGTPDRAAMEVSFVVGVILPFLLAARGPDGARGGCLWLAIVAIALPLGLVGVAACIMGVLAFAPDPADPGVGWNVVTFGALGLTAGFVLLGIIGPVTKVR